MLAAGVVVPMILPVTGSYLGCEVNMPAVRLPSPAMADNGEPSMVCVTVVGI